MIDSISSEILQFQCRPMSWFKWNYELTGNGRQAEIVLGSMSEKGIICVDGESFSVTKESWLMSQWVLRQSVQVVASARKTSPMTRTVEICVGDQTVVLEAESVFRRSYRLRRGNVLLARIYPTSWWSRKATVETYHAETSIALSCFAFWVVLVLWRRAASSS